jgi:hypothetical protein
MAQIRAKKMKTQTYVISGVSHQMTAEQAQRMADGKLTDGDLQSIEVHVGEDRWPGGRVSLATYRANNRFSGDR